MKNIKQEQAKAVVLSPTWGWVSSEFDGSSGRRIAYEFDAGRILWDVFDVEMLKMQYNKVKENNQRLKKKNRELRQALQAAQVCAPDPEPVVELRAISRKKAKVEIAKYFKENDGREIWPDEIVGKLRIDIEMVLDVCEELATEGKIKGL